MLKLAYETIELALNTEWRKADIQLLDTQGKWEKVKYEYKNKVLNIERPVNTMSPVILKLTQKAE